MIKCIVIDDDSVSRSVISHYVEAHSELELLGEFEDASSALKFKKLPSTEIVFTDIEMPGLTGMDLAENIGGETHLVFTTAYENYALKAFDYNVLDYLVKPVHKDRFDKVIEKYKRQKGEEEDQLILRVNRRNVHIGPSEIQYIESYGDYIKVHLVDEVMVVHMTLKKMEGLLPEFFKRIHRCFIVNEKCIKSYSSTMVEVAGKELPVGGKFTIG